TGRDRERPAILGAIVAWISVDAEALGQRERLAEVRFESAHEPELDASGRALNLFRRRSLALDPIEQRVRRQLELRQRVAGTRRDGDPVITDILARRLKRPDLRRGPPNIGDARRDDSRRT